MNNNQVIDDFELQKSMATWSFYKSLQAICEIDEAMPLVDHMSDCFQLALDAMQKQIDALAEQLAAKREHSKMLEKVILDKVTGNNAKASSQNPLAG